MEALVIAVKASGATKVDEEVDCMTLHYLWGTYNIASIVVYDLIDFFIQIASNEAMIDQGYATSIIIDPHPHMLLLVNLSTQQLFSF